MAMSFPKLHYFRSSKNIIPQKNSYTLGQYPMELTSTVFQRLVECEFHYELAEHDKHQHTYNKMKQTKSSIVNIPMLLGPQSKDIVSSPYLCKRSSGKEEDRACRLLHACRQIFTSSTRAIKN